MGLGLVSPTNKGSDGAQELGSIGKRRLCTRPPPSTRRLHLLLWGRDPHVLGPVSEMCS